MSFYNLILLQQIQTLMKGCNYDLKLKWSTQKLKKWSNKCSIKNIYSRFSIRSHSCPSLSSQNRLGQVTEQGLVYLNTLSLWFDYFLQKNTVLLNFKLQAHLLTECVSVFLFLGSFLNCPQGKNLVFFDLRTFALVKGEKMKCAVILPWNERRGEITKFLFTKLCLYVTHWYV